MLLNMSNLYGQTAQDLERYPHFVVLPAWFWISAGAKVLQLLNRDLKRIYSISNYVNNHVTVIGNFLEQFDDG